MPNSADRCRETLLLDAYKAALSDFQYDRADAIEQMIQSKPLSKKGVKAYEALCKNKYCKPKFTDRFPMLAQSLQYSIGMLLLVICIYNLTG